MPNAVLPSRCFEPSVANACVNHIAACSFGICQTVVRPGPLLLPFLLCIRTPLPSLCTPQTCPRRPDPLRAAGTSPAAPSRIPPFGSVVPPLCVPFRSPPFALLRPAVPALPLPRTSDPPPPLPL
ncbi:hypothetical protein Ctob_013592 [Chrysochromulina tobinii]|uniref:Uncharacterized protein n=1 Tax=Chrysochromulina tobinii TaxID=1460289 RepID=A0A0M0JQI5_9EUKA|nr:hypothetical protein Ctob_013592 [Chrysochromulina tobinii]|eukprot:KOO28557.1 hypothetical protein Ctob_013592 [Chrysochromulina sp. CCMP291]